MNLLYLSLVWSADCLLFQGFMYCSVLDPPRKAKPTSPCLETTTTESYQVKIRSACSIRTFIPEWYKENKMQGAVWMCSLTQFKISG